MQHAVVSHDDWLAARRDLLQKEKELTHLRDRVASERLALPWERIEKDYVFDRKAALAVLSWPTTPTA